MQLLGVLLLQMAPDALSGSGWVGAGLLGLVLSWLLFKHLPAKDQQLKDFSDAKDTHVIFLTEHYEGRTNAIVLAFQAEQARTREEFKSHLALILAHCERETSKMASAVQEELKTLHDDQASGGRS